MTDTNSKAQVTDIMLGERDIYEVANQLGGYVSSATEPRLAKFLLREAQAASDLADEVMRLRAALAAQEKPEPRVAIPDGWKLVPTRLTADMMAAASKGLDDTASMNAAYELALAVAPSFDLPEGEVDALTLDVLRRYHEDISAGDVPDYPLALYSYLCMDGYVTAKQAISKVRSSLVPTSPSPIDKGEVK